MFRTVRHTKKLFCNMVYPNLFGNKKEREAFHKEFPLHPMMRKLTSKGVGFHSKTRGYYE